MKHLVSVLIMSTAMAPGIGFAQDADAGESVFKKCKSCHQVGDGAKNKTGPVLTGVLGRIAGTAAEYKYSKSMKVAGEAGLVWDADLVFEYIADPTKFLRGYLSDPKAKAKMSFKLKKEDDRRNVIAYLATFGAADEAKSEEMAAPVVTTAMETAADQLCVRNKASHTHLFVVEATGAERRSQMLEPGQVLCTEASQAETGVVSVFEHADAFEGCSRLVSVGHTEDMLKYVDFDRCAWSSNS